MTKSSVHYNAELDAQLGAIAERKHEILADEQALYDAIVDYLEEPGISAAPEFGLIARAKTDKEKYAAAVKLGAFFDIVAEWQASKEIHNG